MIREMLAEDGAHVLRVLVEKDKRACTHTAGDMEAAPIVHIVPVALPGPEGGKIDGGHLLAAGGAAFGSAVFWGGRRSGRVSRLFANGFLRFAGSGASPFFACEAAIAEPSLALFMPEASCPLFLPRFGGTRPSGVTLPR